MISIALAAYNGSLYIKEQLDSILNQSIQDFELVICDDCSTDNTWDILQDYKAKDSRIRIYRNASNLGFKKNFEKAIGLCHREFIALSDQDDIWESNHLEILINNISTKYISCGNALIIDENDNSKGYTLQELEGMEFVSKNEIDLAYRILYGSNPFQGASMLIRKDFFELAFPIPAGVKYHDAWFSFLSCFYGGIVYTDEIITLHRKHSTNASPHRVLNIKNFIKYFEPQSKVIYDRLPFCRGVYNRIDVNSLSIKKQEFLKIATTFYSTMDNRWYRIRNAYIKFSNYSKIYTTKSKRYFLLRLLKFIIT